MHILFLQRGNQCGNPGTIEADKEKIIFIGV